MQRRFIIALCAAAVFFFTGFTVQAQTPAQTAAPAQPLSAGAVPTEPTADQPSVPFARSLFFTDFEVDLIRKAESGRNAARPDMKPNELIPVDRKIWLGAVYYQSPQNWIIWLNGHKLTPGRLLPEIQGIHVEGEKVALEWFDIGKNGIINITMRPHQIYDIVTGLLLYDTVGGIPPSSGNRARGRR